MSKGYWLAIYKAIHDADTLAEYAKQASIAIAEGGGIFLSRGMPEAMLEGDDATRTVLIEFPSVDAAVNAYGSDSYKKALGILGKAADREIRILNGL